MIRGIFGNFLKKNRNLFENEKIMKKELKYFQSVEFHIELRNLILLGVTHNRNTESKIIQAMIKQVLDCIRLY